MCTLRQEQTVFLPVTGNYLHDGVYRLPVVRRNGRAKSNRAQQIIGRGCRRLRLVGESAILTVRQHLGQVVTMQREGVRWLNNLVAELVNLESLPPRTRIHR